MLLLSKGEGSVPLSGGGGDGLDVLGTKLVSYLDYIDLWVALCSRDAVKVSEQRVGGRREGRGEKGGEGGEGRGGGEGEKGGEERRRRREGGGRGK